MPKKAKEWLQSMMITMRTSIEIKKKEFPKAKVKQSWFEAKMWERNDLQVKTRAKSLETVETFKY